MQLPLFQTPDESADNGCQFPEHKGLTGYKYGCRCVRCRTAHNRYSPKQCIEDGCSELRALVKGAKRCSEHLEIENERRRVAMELAERRRQTKVTVTCVACATTLERYAYQMPKLPLCKVHQHLGKLRNQLINHRMGDSPKAEWWLRLAAQDRLTCPICTQVIGLDAEFHVDHDHSCCGRSDGGCPNCVRGVLHARCNVAVGWVEKSGPEKTRAIIAYLGWQPPRF